MTGEIERHNQAGPSIPIAVIEQWVHEKLAVIVAELVTLAEGNPTTTRDRFRQGLDTAQNNGSLEVLNELDKYLKVWPDTNIDK
jgi:hypothetical protein